MKRSYGSKSTKIVDHFNKRGCDYYFIRWDFNDIDNHTVSYIEEKFTSKPQLKKIQFLINDWYNTKIDNKIKSEFVWKDKRVWLSIENQLNYKSCLDIAISSKGNNLPITFKFGLTDSPEYYTFESVDELKEFHELYTEHIIKTLNDGWKEKDSINWEDYKNFLK